MATKFAPRPDHIFVGADTYSVQWLTEHEWSAEQNDANWAGLTEHTARRIQMRIMATPAPEAHYQTTLLHEIMHCVWAQSGLMHTHKHFPQDEREEETITMLSSPMLFVLKHNPHVMAYLLADGTVQR